MVLWCINYIVMTNPDVVFYIFISTSQLYVQHCGPLTGAAQCDVYKWLTVELTDDMEMCMCLWSTKPTWRHQHSFSLDLSHLHMWRAESVLQNCVVGWCVNLHIATSPLLWFYKRTWLDKNLLVNFEKWQGGEIVMVEWFCHTALVNYKKFQLA